MHTLNIQQWLLEFGLPVIYALIGTSGGRILAQDGLSREVNGIIAWLVVIACAVATAWGSNQLIGDPYGILSTLVGIITILVSSALSSLRPYLIYLDWLEQHVFNIVPAPLPPSTKKPAPQPIIFPNSSKDSV